MSKVVKRCKNDGLEYPPSATECEKACFSPLFYWCETHQGWIDTMTCVPCQERGKYDQRLAAAKARGDADAACQAARQIYERYGKKKGDHYTVTQLQEAVTTWRACTASVESLDPADIRSVGHAKDCFSDARRAFQAAGVAVSKLDSIEPDFAEFEEALREIERLRQQQTLAVRAVGKALGWGAIAWTLVFLLACFASRFASTEDRRFATFEWTRNVLAAIAAGLFVQIVPRKSWGVPGWILQVACVVLLLCAGVFIQDMPTYWPGLIFTIIALPAIVWIIELGIDPAEDTSSAVRDAAVNIVERLSATLLPRHSATLVLAFVGVFMLALWVRAPTRKPPNRPPTTELVAPERIQAVAGQPLTLQIRGTDPDGDALTYEFRTDLNGPWRAAAGGNITLPALASSSITVEARVRDQAFVSDAVTYTWTVRRPENRPPTVHFVNADAIQPEAGRPLTIPLAGDDPDGDRLTFEYRIGTDPVWKSTAQDHIDLGPLQAGPLHVFARAKDNEKFSDEIDKSWDVKEPTKTVATVPAPDQVSDAAKADRLPNAARDAPKDKDTQQPKTQRPPTIRIARFEPDPPLVGADFAITLHGSADDGGSLDYQYRKVSSDSWQEALGGTAKLTQLSAGKLELEFQATDRAGQSKSISRSWDVDRHRFEITGLMRDQGRLKADIRDNQKNETHRVGASDTFAGFSVVRIDATNVSVLLKANSGYVTFSGPKHLGTAFAQSQTPARTEARSSASSTARSKSRDSSHKKRSN